MASKLQICNLALSMLGAGRIAALDEGTENATLCSLLFDDLADEVITKGSWTSCIFRASLSPLAEDPVFGFSTTYQLPEDPYCLRLLEATNASGSPVNHQVEGRTIVTDSSTLNIKYIGRPASASDFDPMLSNAIMHRLKYSLAHPVTGQLAAKEGAWREYEAAMVEGKRVNGKQGTPDLVRYNPLIQVR